MKIVYCIAATYNSGGMERVLANKVAWLTARGHEIIILTTDQDGRPDFFPMPPGVRHIDLGINYEANNGASFLSKFLAFPGKKRRHRTRLRKALRSLNPDITVSMMNNDASILARIPEGGRKVLEVHFSRFKRLQYGRRGFWAMADRWFTHRDLDTARRFDRFVVLTRQDSAFWHGVPDMTVIPNAATFPRTVAASLARKRVLAVGRLSAQKGFDRLLEAWARVAPAHPGWILDIAGTGPLEQQLRRQAAELGIESSVRFLGAVANMRSLYLTSSILAMTSRYEGLPMALIEAQTCGLPAVAMDCKCGPRDIISDGLDGFITPEADIGAFAARLSELMDNPHLLSDFGAHAFQASQRFDEDRVMQRWFNLFSTLLNR